MAEKCPECGKEAKYLYSYQPKEASKITAQVYECSKCGRTFEKWIDRERGSQEAIQLQLPLKSCKIG
jgi:DNA-directed RNA polymerase subunit RPC12/RpoP